MAAKKGRPVIVCTEHKGVFFGFADDTSGDVIRLRNARMAIYWGTSRGLFELAEEGPNSSSRSGQKLIWKSAKSPRFSRCPRRPGSNGVP